MQLIWDCIAGGNKETLILIKLGAMLLILTTLMPSKALKIKNHVKLSFTGTGV
jgi:hypothetical protein